MNFSLFSGVHPLALDIIITQLKYQNVDGSFLDEPI